MQTGQDFRDIQLGFPGRPQVVFNRFTDSHPNPASRPQAPPDLVLFDSSLLAWGVPNPTDHQSGQD